MIIEVRGSGKEQSVADRYTETFLTAEQAVNREALALPTDIQTIIHAARRVGRIMNNQFPVISQADWIHRDLELVTGHNHHRVEPVLNFVEKTIWAYQPVSDLYSETAVIRLGRDINPEEIDIVAFDMLEHIIHWRWDPQLPNPANVLSKLVASTLSHVHQEAGRRIEPDMPLTNPEISLLVDESAIQPERYVIKKEELTELLSQQHLSVDEALALLDRENQPFSPMHAKGTRYHFPVPVSDPFEIWAFICNLHPHEQVAILHNLGYLYQEKTAKQVEEHVGLHQGHLRAILKVARQKILEQWHEDGDGNDGFSLDHVREIVHNASLVDMHKNALQNGRTARLISLRSQLQNFVEIHPDAIDWLSAKRGEVVALYLQGFTAHEVGEKLGISSKKVLAYVAKAATILRSKYQD